MMSQPYELANKEHVDEEMDILREHEHPRSECKKSLFVQPLQDTPPDAASNQHEQPLLSPSTLGVAIKGAMKGSSQPLPQKKPKKRPSRKDLAAKMAANASSSRSFPPTGFADRVPMKGTRSAKPVGGNDLLLEALAAILAAKSFLLGLFFGFFWGRGCDEPFIAPLIATPSVDGLSKGCSCWFEAASRGVSCKGCTKRDFFALKPRMLLLRQNIHLLVH